ncbi:MAG: hypothetical protein LBU66_08885 [Treponema sp.]|nr:hypothetical protein [Treponema sp.]
MKKWLVFSVLLLVFSGLAVSQQNGEFVPHVTGVSAEPRNHIIRLTWVDSPDARGPVYIFRSARPFTGALPANIRPVTVNYGEQYYMDDTDEMENLHYFIAASDVSGERFDVIIHSVNTASIGVSQPPAPVAQTPPVEAAPVIQGISNLRTRQEGERVIITFNHVEQLDVNQRSAILYRSMQPVRRPQDLLNATIVQSRVTSPFTDIPVPGINWYYAVVFEDEISLGNVGIRPGINATSTAILISTDRTAGRAMRPMPLPVLSLRDTSSGFIADVSHELPLSSDSVRMIQNARFPSQAPQSIKAPRVFAMDLQTPAGGEESALFQIIKDHFERFDWEGARVSLQHYLSLPRSKEVEARGRFYLGQTLYYTGNYREALMEFLSFRSFNPVEANAWVDAVLSAMVN